jgi:hypothetical protein
VGVVMDEENKKHIKEKLDNLIPIFANASVGDFSKNVPIPDADDEFSVCWYSNYG